MKLYALTGDTFSVNQGSIAKELESYSLRGNKNRYFPVMYGPNSTREGTLYYEIEEVEKLDNPTGTFGTVVIIKTILGVGLIAIFSPVLFKIVIVDVANRYALGKRSLTVDTEKFVQWLRTKRDSDIVGRLNLSNFNAFYISYWTRVDIPQTFEGSITVLAGRE